MAILVHSDGEEVTSSKIPQTQFIENAHVLGQLINGKRTAMGMKLADCVVLYNVGINTLSRIENSNDNCTLAAVFSAVSGLDIKLTSPSLAPDSIEKRDDSSICTDGWV